MMLSSLQTENSTCEISFNVQIRNCGNYLIYLLKNTTQNAAYCFGNKFNEITISIFKKKIIFALQSFIV